MLPRLADYCIIYVADGENGFERVAFRHSLPEMSETLRQFCELPLDTSSSGAVGRVFHEQTTVIENAISMEQFASYIPDPTLREVLLKLNPRACIVAPLVVADRSVGAITLVRSLSDEKYDERDQVLVEEVGRRIAYAIEHAKLYENSQASQRAQQFLTLASLELARSLDYKTTLTNIAQQVVPGLADWCRVDILGANGELEVVALTHADPEKLLLAKQLREKYSMKGARDEGVQGVIQSGQPVLAPTISEELLRERAEDQEHWRLLQQFKIGSAMIVPLFDEGKPVGAITFVHSERGRYGSHDLELAQELATRASLALTNARLYASLKWELSEKERAEAELRKLADELEDKIEERTSELLQINEQLQGFTYTVAHDLRQHIRGISVNASMALQDSGPELSEDVRTNLKRLTHSAKQLASIVDDLLNYAKLGQKEPDRVQIDISAIAAEIAEDCEMKYRLGADVMIEPNLCVVADATMTRIVLENLLDNAFKYSKPGTRIVVGKAGEELYVRDTGSGFDMAFADRLFVPFERLHSNHEVGGTGIGLANVKRIVEKHGGSIRAESEVGRGTTFSFTL